MQEVLSHGEAGSCRIGRRAREYLESAANADGRVLQTRVLVSRSKLDYRWGHTVEVTRERGTRVEHWDGYGYAVGSIIPDDKNLRQATSDRPQATP